MLRWGALLRLAFWASWLDPGRFTSDVRVFVICLPLRLLAVLLWWWLMKDADDAGGSSTKGRRLCT